jgi:hypothetical protein
VRAGEGDDEPLPEVTILLPALRRDNPWPELVAGLEPFYLSLDGGGRHLITEVIREQRITLMVEIGCFLCGSTRQWLEASEDLTVIGVDPWDGNWSTYLRSLAEKGRRLVETLTDPMAAADAVQLHGNYQVALNNIREFRDRFIPVRRRSPEALRYLHRRRIRPQLIYIDAAKDDDELRVAHALFPNAILCGDDWNWPDDDGRYRMREHVERFVAEHGFSVDAVDETWIISKPAVPERVGGPLGWDAAAVDQLLREIAPLEREVLLRVAHATRHREALSLSALAEALGATLPELLEAVGAINATPARTARRRVLGLGDGDPGASFGNRPLELAAGLGDLLAERDPR